MLNHQMTSYSRTFASSAPSGIIDQLTAEFRMSQLTATLTISLFVTGYCVGPILWGPLSERFGRKPIFIYSFFLYTLTQMGLALSKNTSTVLVLRFLGGCLAASSVSNCGAVVSDVWDAKTRGKGLAIMSATPFVGPALGPAVAGFIGAQASWRWVFWLLTAFTGLCWLLVVFTVPETYSPVLLAAKAGKMRFTTGDERYFAALERDPMRPMQIFNKVLALPFKIVFQEPMLIAMTVYLSVR
ncbi:hypothetical protein CVT26_004061 [Gymnopilus dilepis]|uniref:Major facilitator superfamily (MFS) profile domain-containing protein n=1 Tax=Gymnopilus dilepis TaxID=231916 RepID=A0A409YMH3_9AGAR|nr:hypothetical protein CVT26_004061 [Gymnopilus dilepis]